MSRAKNTLFIFAVAGFLIVAVAVLGQVTTGPSTQPSVEEEVSKIQYVPEYAPPTVENPVGEISITIFRPASDRAIARILRKELEKQIARDAPTTDMITFAYLHKRGTNPKFDGNIGDSDLDPCYIFDLKKIVPWSEGKKINPEVN